MNSLIPELPTKTRVLIVEDEPLIALDLEDILLDAGFEIAGVASTLGIALAMIDGHFFDVAILDANLGGVSAGPAAAALLSQNLPFLVLSGYTASQQPPEMRNALLLAKPIDGIRLVVALNGLVQV